MTIRYDRRVYKPFNEKPLRKENHMNNKLKKFVKDHEYELLGAFAGLVAITTYTYACKKLGYEMVKPMRYDDNYFYVKTLGGKMLKCEMIPLTES